MPDIVLILEATERMRQPLEEAVRASLQAHYQRPVDFEVVHRAPYQYDTLSADYLERISGETANAVQRCNAKFCGYVTFKPLQVHAVRIARAVIAVADTRGLAGIHLIAVEHELLSAFAERLIGQRMAGSTKRTPQEAIPVMGFAQALTTFQEHLAVPLSTRLRAGSP